jgi:hypothetical protein
LRPISDLLHRFRPIGVPGSASRAGIPADRAAELAAELDPVLSMLGPTQGRCQTVVAGAGQTAARVSGEAATRAVTIAAEGRDRAMAARVAATNEVIAAAQAEADRIERAAAQAVLARQELGEAEILTLVELAVHLVKSAPGA